jgi:tetratricopeptide (TPR) repeat protein
MRSLWIAIFLGAAVFAAGCGGGKLPEAQKKEQAALPEGHPPTSGEAGGGAGPMSGSMLGSEGPTDGNALPLKLTGLSSVEELEHGLSMTENAEAKTVFEAGFRKTFTADPTKRDYQGAIPDLEKALALDPKFAAAYRAMGYAKFNMGFNVDGALADYKKAIELKPDYGEAHYALAFMYAMADRDKGVEHFKKAMELGVPDERNLGEKFYPDK